MNYNFRSTTISTATKLIVLTEGDRVWAESNYNIAMKHFKNDFFLNIVLQTFIGVWFEGDTACAAWNLTLKKTKVEFLLDGRTASPHLLHQCHLPPSSSRPVSVACPSCEFDCLMARLLDYYISDPVMISWSCDPVTLWRSSSSSRPVSFACLSCDFAHCLVC